MSIEGESNFSNQETIARTYESLEKIQQQITAALEERDYDRVISLATEAKAATGELFGEYGKGLDDTVTAQLTEEERQRVAKEAEEAQRRSLEEEARREAELRNTQEPAGIEEASMNLPPECAEMLEKYGERMRADSAAMLEVMANEQKFLNENSQADGLPQDEITRQLSSFMEQRTRLMLALKRGEGVIPAPQASNEQERQRRVEQGINYGRAALSDPETVLNLARSGAFYGGTGPNEGLGQVNVGLRSNATFMEQMLEAMPNPSSFWVYVAGNLKQNRSLYEKAIQIDASNYQYGLPEWKEDPKIKAMVTGKQLLHQTELQR